MWGATGDETALAEDALRILYQRKAFREETGMDEEHYLLASGIGALLGTGLALHGSFPAQLAAAAALACAVSNLPAAAALVPAGPPGLWAAVLATAVGPNLLITGHRALGSRPAGPPRPRDVGARNP